MNPFLLGRCYHRFLPLINRLPLRLQVKLASAGRNYFMQHFVARREIASYIPHSGLKLTMWGLNFRSPLANSAGMFKNGEGYDTVAALGAGAYIGGTSTANPRNGNLRHHVHLPFISLPQAGIALNWLGLPNLGDEVLSIRELTKRKLPDCPIGWSVMRSPDFSEEEGITRLISSLSHYHDNPQIDFIEINESCPNIKNSGANIMPRLELIARKFLAVRERNLPVVVKLSNDISTKSLPEILEGIIRLGYDGINLGNTSTDYASIQDVLSGIESELFAYFTSHFGGGVSGSALRARSLQLCSEAAELLQHLRPAHEFHIIRSGGIANLNDIIESRRHGVSFNQWYTGFFNAYNLYGDDVYCRFWQG